MAAHLDADALAARLASFRDDPDRSAICTDFDGTLAAVVLEPDAVVPLPGVVELLDDLADRYGRVAVISGRPLAFLDAHLPGRYTRSGLYGLEERVGGVRHEHPEADAWRAMVATVVADAAQGAPRGARIEDKGLSLTVHYREHPEARDDVEAWVAAQADRTGLVPRAARQSVELHPPIEADKGTVLERLADGFRNVCFLGDDVGDLPAFVALDRLRSRGVVTLSVAVCSPETDPAVLAAADVAVDGPEGALALLRRLSG